MTGRAVVVILSVAVEGLAVGKLTVLLGVKVKPDALGRPLSVGQQIGLLFSASMRELHDKVLFMRN